MPASLIRILPLLALCACGTVQPEDAPAADAAGGATDTGMDSPMPDAPPSCGDQNYVLSFDGQQYIAVPDSGLVRPPGDLTIEAWVRFDGIIATNYHCIVIKTLGSASNDSYAIWYDAGGLHAMINLGLPNTTTATYAWTPVLGRWYHVAFTFTLAT
jgi:hypothetical protein